MAETTNQLTLGVLNQIEPRMITNGHRLAGFDGRPHFLSQQDRGLSSEIGAAYTVIANIYSELEQYGPAPDTLRMAPGTHKRAGGVTHAL